MYKIEEPIRTVQGVNHDLGNFFPDKARKILLALEQIKKLDPLPTPSFLKDKNFEEFKVTIYDRGLSGSDLTFSILEKYDEIHYVNEREFKLEKNKLIELTEKP